MVGCDLVDGRRAKHPLVRQQVFDRSDRTLVRVAAEKSLQFAVPRHHRIRAFRHKVVMGSFQFRRSNLFLPEPPCHLREKGIDRTFELRRQEWTVPQGIHKRIVPFGKPGIACPDREKRKAGTLLRRALVGPFPGSGDLKAGGQRLLHSGCLPRLAR